MTSHVRTVSVEDRLSQVRRALVDEGIHHLPVVEDGRLVGIISSRDFVRLYQGFPEPGGPSLDETTSVRETMTTDLVTLRADEPVERAIELISDGRFHSVLVIEDERLVGIVTDTDLVDFLYG